MINKLRIAILSLTVFASSTVFAQDKKDIFNPVNTSVTSQTIAPDARAAGMGDVGAANIVNELIHILDTKTDALSTKCELEIL